MADSDDIKISPTPDAAVTGADAGGDTDPPLAQTPAQAAASRAMARFEYEMGLDDDNRRNHVEDLKFAWIKGAQWNDQVRRQRDTAKPPRPWLEFNQTGQFIKQVVNNQRQNQPAIKVRPKSSGATKQVADIYSGIIRDAEYNSAAPAIYDGVLEQSVTGGRGYCRMTTEYEREDSFNQVFRLKAIPDAMNVVYDSAAKEPDKSDARYCFVMEWIDRKTFEEEWPEAQSNISWDDTGGEYSSYFANGKVCVADYYEVVEVEINLLALSDGSVMWEDDYKQKLELTKQQQALDLAAAPPMGINGMAMPPQLPAPTVKKSEPRNRRRVDWYKLSACPDPLEKYEWLGKYLPVFMCPGDEITIEGNRIYQGIIRRLRDAQMMYNYWFTLATELIALAPKAPYVALDGQIENHPEWKTLSTENHNVLEFDAVQVGDQWFATPPQRTEAVQLSPALMQMLQMCAQNLREITGMKDAVLGQGRPEQPLGAILAEQQKGDVATFHYGDNLARMIRLIGVVAVDLIPRIYDVQRQVAQLAEDGTQSSVTVNQTMPDGKTLNDLSAGEYDVVVDVGPSFATRRTEAAKEMQEFMQVVGPETAMPIGAIMAKNIDWPGDTGEKVSAVLTAMLPPALQAIVNGDDAQDPQVLALQQQMQAQGQQFQQFATQMQQQMAKLSDDNSELKLKVANNAMDFASKLIEESGKRQDRAQARAAESENSASQEFIAKLSAVESLLTNFTKMVSVGVDPASAIAQMTSTVQGISGALRSGPDFGDTMQMLANSSQQGNDQVNSILQSVLPDGVPQPNAPQQPPAPQPGAAPPQQPQPGAMPPNGAQ